MNDLQQIIEALEAYLRAARGEGWEMNGAQAKRAIDAAHRLEAREAEAPKDVVALVERLGELADQMGQDWPELGVRYAAAIERFIQSRISAEPKRVPMAMLRHCMSICKTDSDIRRLVKQHGYEVTE